MLCIRALVVVALLAACGGGQPDSALVTPVVDDDAACGSPLAYAGGSFFEHDGARIWYRLDGAEGAPVIGVLHGGPGYNSYTFDQTGGALLRDTFRVLSFDQRGCGRSWQIDASAAAGMRATIDDLEALRRHLDVEAMHLVAHSFGGVVAVEYAAAFPASVGRIVFVETAPDLSSALQYQLESAARLSTESFPEHTAALMDLAGGEAPVIERLTRAYALVGRVELQGALHWASADNQTRLDRLDEESALLSCTQGRAVRAFVDAGYLSEDLPRLHRVEHPAILFGGRASQVIGAAGLEAASADWNAPLVWFERSGHFVYAEEPARFAAEVRTFLLGD